MTPESVMTMGRVAMEVTLMVAAPMLLVALVIGLVVSIFQAATQINEASIGFLAKLVVMAVTLAALGSWSMQNLVDYTHRTIGSIADVIR